METEVKKLFFLIVLLGLISSQAQAMSGVSKGGHTACLKKEWLDDIISFVVAKDMDSFQAYLDSQKCIVLKEGLRVTITESPGFLGGTTGFVFRGIKLWTVREAFDYGS
jgi:hypothetical protein